MHITKGVSQILSLVLTSFLLSVFAYALKWVDFNILDFLNESGICDDMLLLN